MQTTFIGVYSDHTRYRTSGQLETKLDCDKAELTHRSRGQKPHQLWLVTPPRARESLTTWTRDLDGESITSQRQDNKIPESTSHVSLVESVGKRAEHP